MKVFHMNALFSPFFLFIFLKCCLFVFGFFYQFLL